MVKTHQYRSLRVNEMIRDLVDYALSMIGLKNEATLYNGEAAGLQECEAED